MKTKLLLAITTVCLLFSSCGSGGEGLDKNMIPVRKEGKTLYVDHKGKVVLEIDSGYSEYFSDGLALYSKNGLYGYINKKGKVVIEPQYKNALSFAEGLAWVVKENGFPEAINTSGKVKFVLEQADKVYPFSDGLAVFETIDKEGYVKYGCVNKSGKIVMEPQNNSISNFKEGKAVIVNENYKSGYIDKSGKTIIECQFDKAIDFSSNGLACVQFGDKWGVINTEGEYVINPQFAMIYPDGNWFMILVDNKLGWCDKNGKYVINPQFENILPFGDNDLAPVSIDDKKWGFVNRKGFVELPYQFDKATPFINNKIAIVGLNNQYGLVDKKGKYVLNPIYEDVNNDFLELIFWGKRKYEYLYSDYFDMDGVVSTLTEIITNDGIDGNAYTASVGDLMKKYTLTQANFPKRDSSVELKKGKISNDAEYSIDMNGMPWKKTSEGWFANYNFNPEYIPYSYTVTVKLSYRKEGKAAQLAKKIYEGFSGSTLNEEIISGYSHRIPGNNKELSISFSKEKIFINVKHITPVTLTNIDALGKHNDYLGKTEEEMARAFNKYQKYTEYSINGGYSIAWYNLNGTESNMFVVLKQEEGKENKIVMDVLEIKKADLPSDKYIGHSLGKKDGNDDTSIIAIYQIDDQDDFLEEETFTKIAQAWRVKEKTGKFEKMDVKGITMGNEGYGIF